MTSKITAARILKQIREKHLNADVTLPHAFYSEVKTGPSLGQGGHKLYIMDAVAIEKSWAKPCIHGYEIKVSRSDFLRDKKWQNYQKYCHKLSFVCPPNVIKIDELPGDVGLIYYSPDHDTLFVKRRAMYRKINLRSPEIVNMLMYLVMYQAEKQTSRQKVGEIID